MTRLTALTDFALKCPRTVSGGIDTHGSRSDSVAPLASTCMGHAGSTLTPPKHAF